MKTLVVRTCRAAMNRRIGRLAAVVVVLVVLSSSAACGSDNTKAVDRGTASGSISSSTMPGSPSTMPGSPSTMPGSPSTNPMSSGTLSRLAPDPTYLVDLKAVAGYMSGTGQTKVNAHEYLKSITLNVSGGTQSIEYDLNKQWNYFLAIVGLPDDAPADAQVTFQVFMDNQQLASETNVTLGHPKAVRVPAQGALRLKLVATQTSGGWSSAVWADAQLTNDATLRQVP
jgi:NPCBM/NEW2 domain